MAWCTEDGRAQGEALTAARQDLARKLKAALLDGFKKEESREKREEKREKRENRRKLDSLQFYTVPEGRDGREKGRPPGEKREDSREKREEKIYIVEGSKVPKK